MMKSELALFLQIPFATGRKETERSQSYPDTRLVQSFVQDMRLHAVDIPDSEDAVGTTGVRA